MKYVPLGLWLVATPFLGSVLPTTIAAGIAGSTAAHTSDRGLRGGTADTPHTPHDLQQNPPSEPINAEVSLDAAAAADDDFLGRPSITASDAAGRFRGIPWWPAPVPDCGTPPLQYDYRGRVSHTKSYLTCQSWSSQTPHKHTMGPKEFPFAGLDDNWPINNHCRNPDGDSGGAWCYTTDPKVRYEYCDVPICADCGTPPLQSDYRGPVSHTNGRMKTIVSHTKSGLTCQFWSSQTPHAHINGPERWPLAGLADNNHCRNPDEDSGGPWCYTTDPDVRYGYCDVPVCADETDAPAPDGGGAYAEN